MVKKVHGNFTRHAKWFEIKLSACLVLCAHAIFAFRINKVALVTVKPVIAGSAQIQGRHRQSRTIQALIEHQNQGT